MYRSPLLSADPMNIYSNLSSYVPFTVIYNYKHLKKLIFKSSFRHIWSGSRSSILNEFPFHMTQQFNGYIYGKAYYETESGLNQLMKFGALVNTSLG